MALKAAGHRMLTTVYLCKEWLTQTALIKVVDEWLSNIDIEQVTAVIFLDLAKAFDAVKHSILVRKLHWSPLGHWTWFRLVYFMSRQSTIASIFQQCALVDRTQSIRGSQRFGPPTLLPLLFLVYINDLSSCISHSNVYSFADDTA